MTNELNGVTFGLVDPKNGPNQEIKISDVKPPASEGLAASRMISLNDVELFDIDNQQLFELGTLLITLAGKNVDFDSAIEMIDGYFELDAVKILRHAAKKMSE